MPVDTSGILTWNRLEPRPRVEDFDRVLRAEVRDALWMMTRQWQFGEFQGEDTGSALFSKVKMKTAKQNRIQLKSGTVHAVDNKLPIEADVEKEPIVFDFLMRLEMGRYWEKLVGRRIRKGIAGDDATKQAYIDDVIKEFRTATDPKDLSFHVPDKTLTSSASFYSNPDLWHATAALKDGRGIDGYILYEWFQNELNDPNAFIGGGVTLDPAIPDILTTCKKLYLSWFKRNYAAPEIESDSAWNASQLEYQFTTAGPHTSNTNTDVLVAEEYAHGRLDWYAFDYEKNSDNYNLDLEAAGEKEEEVFTLIPTQLTYVGMPNPRWWQMEDGRVDLGDVNPSTTDIAKVIFSEFGLIYSNDWMIFPYTTESGNMCELQDIIVTDCFGQRTKIVSASEGEEDDWTRWSFFGITTKEDPDVLPSADTRLFIPNVTSQLLESEPIESVNFIRDEIGNMVWAIEKVVPNGFGGGIDGYETSLKYVDFLKELSVLTPPTLIENDATIQYKVANTVPENWIPFIPVKVSNTLFSQQIQLQRAAMPRYVDGLSDIGRVRPRTPLLRENVTNLGEVDESWGAYYIHEEEVPRAGVTVKKTWQRTRATDGTVIVWSGRRKQTGRGEGSSNLAFDQIEYKP